MEISKAFRDVMRKKYEKLKQEEAQDLTTQPKVGPTEGPSISDVQKKILEVAKTKRKYDFDFGEYLDENGNEKPLTFSITAYLSKNEDKAFKELIDEINASFETRDPDIIGNTTKELLKVIKMKAKDYSIELLKALHDLFLELSGINRKYRQGLQPGVIDSKYERIGNSLNNLANYIENIAKRRKPSEYESDALPSMELLGEKGTRRQRAQQLINLVQGVRGAPAPPIDPNDPELLEVLEQLEGEEEEEGGRRRKAKKQVGGKKKAK
jgi:hypothetical protein